MKTCDNAISRVIPDQVVISKTVCETEWICQKSCWGQELYPWRNLCSTRPGSRMLHMKGMSGAEGFILGCTEIGLLVRSGDCRVPLFDTTRIHAEAAVDFALAE